MIYVGRRSHMLTGARPTSRSSFDSLLVRRVRRLDITANRGSRCGRAFCHQGDVYDASCAALPYIVEIACNAKEPVDFRFFQLPTAIEIAGGPRKRSANSPDLDEAYGTAVS